MLGRPGSQRIDTLVHDLIETSAAAGDIVQSDEIGGPRCSRCAPSCSSASTSARRRGPSTSAPTRRSGASSRQLADRGDEPDEITEFIAGMTDRFALDTLRASDGADQGHAPSRRCSGRRLRRRRRGADAAAQGGRAARRPLPVPRGAHAELLGQRPSTSSTTASAAARAAT